MNNCLKDITEGSEEESNNSSNSNNKNNDNENWFYFEQNIAIRYFWNVNKWGQMFNENIQLLFWT